MLFMEANAPSHTVGYYYGHSVMILVVTFYFNEHIYHIKKKIHLFFPQWGKKIHFLGKKQKQKTVHSAFDI